jgi:integrase
LAFGATDTELVRRRASDDHGAPVLDGAGQGREQDWPRAAVQELLGHSDLKTTMIDTHLLNKSGLGVRSPLDRSPQDWN